MCNVYSLMKMLMCEGEHTFLKVNLLGVKEVLMVYLVSILFISLHIIQNFLTSPLITTSRKEKKEVPSLM